MTAQAIPYDNEHCCLRCRRDQAAVDRHRERPKEAVVRRSHVKLLSPANHHALYIHRHRLAAHNDFERALRAGSGSLVA